MIPLTLNLRNFLSYRGSVTIDFRPLTVACLSGENGAGKSALLDAITWAIWGKSRARSDNDLISLGEEEMEVTFTFRMGAREYRVMRRRSKSKPTLEFDTRALGSENWLPIGGDSIRDTEARIVDELRLDYDTFVNSALLQQGQADRFTRNQPSERKRILGEILNLAVYDQLAKEARDETRRAREQMDRVQERISRIDLALAERHEIEVQAAELDDQISASDQKLSQLQGKIDVLQARIKTAEITEDIANRASARLQRIEAGLVEAERRQVETAAELKQLDEILGRAESIKADAESFRRWRKLADDCANKMSARQPILERVRELESQIQAKTAEQSRNLALLRQSIGSLEARAAEAEERASELRACEAEAATLRPITQALQAKQGELNRLQDEMTQLTGENSSLMARMEDIKTRIASLTDGDAHCPVCRRPLADGEHEHIHAEWTAEGRQLGDAYRANRDRIAALKREIDAGRKELAQIEAAARRLEALTTQAEGLRAQLATLPELVDQLEREREELRNLEQLIASGDYIKSEQEEMSGLQLELEAIRYDPDEHDRARREVERLAGAEEQLAALERATSDQRALSERLSDIDGQIKALTTEKSEVEGELKELRAALEGIDEVRKLHGAKCAEQRAAAEAHRELERRRGEIRRRLNELDEQAEEKKELEKQAAELSSTIDAYRELTTAFGRDGIQAMIIENILPELEHEANRLLERMTSRQLAIQFRTTREAVSSDSIIETLDIIISDEDGQRPYQLFSGGEAFRIDFAIRVALAKLLARRAGASVETLIIDEGFGTQDQQGRDGLVEALQSVSGDFDLILAITHIDELRDQFPNRIEIVKTAEGSRATVI